MEFLMWGDVTLWIYFAKLKTYNHWFNSDTNHFSKDLS
jgi:hypothetical protein